MKLRDFTVMVLAFLLIGFAYADRMKADAEAAERERVIAKAQRLRSSEWAELDKTARYMTSWDRIR